jgi:hypothetical protein
MRKALFIILAIVATQAKAADDVGIGGILGSPTGISGHLMLDKDEMLVGALGYGFWHYSGLYFHTDYVIVDPSYGFNIKTAEWDVYYGVGGRFVAINSGDDKDKMNLGVRVPVGVLHRLRKPRFLVFGEIVPVLNIAPRTEIGFDAGIGARFLFD